MSDTAGFVLTQINKPDTSQDCGQEIRNILGVDVCAITVNSAISEIENVLENNAHQKYAFLNAHGGNIAFEDAEYRANLSQFTVFSDGIGVDIGSKILYGDTFPGNLNGTDFIPRLFNGLSSSRIIGLLGAKPGVADDAAEVFSRSNPNHSFVVISDGYFDVAGEKQVVARLRDVQPDILLVALGNPTQEKWIADHCNIENVNVPIGVGALFDFTAGRVSRAPKWMVSGRIEWLYRLIQEPKRMWRRYLLGNPLFLMRIMRQKIFGLQAKSET